MVRDYSPGTIHQDEGEFIWCCKIDGQKYRLYVDSEGMVDVRLQMF